MAPDLKCGSCGAPMEITLFAPGDKIAKCPFCGTTVDLPDDQQETREKISEYNEHEQGEGYSKKRVVKITERSSTTTVNNENFADEMMDQLKHIMDDLSHGRANAQTVSEDGQKVATFSSTTTTSSHDMMIDGDELDLPRDFQSMMRDITFDPPQRKMGATAPKKKSFWQRLFGKT